MHNRAGVPAGHLDFRRIVLEHLQPECDVTCVLSWLKAGAADLAEHPRCHLRRQFLTHIGFFIAPPAFQLAVEAVGMRRQMGQLVKHGAVPLGVTLI